MNKYILLSAEDAEKIQEALKSLDQWHEGGCAACGFKKNHAPYCPVILVRSLIPSPIEVSEEAREFVSSIRKGDGFNPRMALTDDEATAMLAARDKCTRDKAIRDCLEYIMIKGPSILHTLLKED